MRPAAHAGRDTRARRRHHRAQLGADVGARLGQADAGARGVRDLQSIPYFHRPLEGRPAARTCAPTGGVLVSSDVPLARKTPSVTRARARVTAPLEGGAEVRRG